MVVVNDSSAGVSMDEANILADFFNLQANKHGPELLRKLNNLGGGEATKHEAEQRKQIKIEDEAESVMRSVAASNLEQGYRKQSSSSNNSHKGLRTFEFDTRRSLYKDESDKSMTQCGRLVSQDPTGQVVSLLPEHILRSWPLLQTTSATQGSAVHAAHHAAARGGGVSVIQKVPKQEMKLEGLNPNIILERRPDPMTMGMSLAGVNGDHGVAPVTAMFNSLSSHTTLSLVPGKRPILPNNESSTSSRGKKSNQQQSDHLICEVCGERAGKHSYYGGQVCPSCRAFFRRSVQSRYNETFRCTKGYEDCVINLLTRKNCQYCRYQKCLGAGMRPSWILSDEERVRRFQGRSNLKGVNKKTAKNMSKTEEPMIEDEDSGSIGGNSSTEAVEQPEEVIDSIEKIGLLIRRICIGRHDDMEPELVQKLLQVTLQDDSMTTATASQLGDIIEARTAACLQLLPEFQSLQAKDQRAIMEHNLPLIHRFRQSLCLSSDKLDWKRIAGALIGDKLLEEAEENLPTDLSGSPKKQFLYESLFNGESIPMSIMRDITSWVDVEDQRLLVLLVLILAFNHDLLDLEDRQLVEKIQLKYVVLLQVHMRSKYANNSLAACKLAKAVMLPSMARELVNLTKNCPII